MMCDHLAGEDGVLPRRSRVAFGMQCHNGSMGAKIPSTDDQGHVASQRAHRSEGKHVAASGDPLHDRNQGIADSGQASPRYLAISSDDLHTLLEPIASAASRYQL